MYVDISKPPPALPTPSLTSVSSGVSLLPPLSRNGTGPGIIILTPDSEENIAIKNGVPSPLRKWGEEGYSVVEIREEALKSDKDALKNAIAALSHCGKCEPKGVVGLVAYGPKLWNAVAPNLSSFKEIIAAVIYADAHDSSNLVSTSLPLICHLAGKVDGKALRTPQRTEYDYPQVNTYSFATPFQKDFNYSAEAVSQTRNLTFLKKHMNGPFFDLEAIWDEHTYFEFENRSVEHTMATMVDEPYVNHVPTMTGGIGRTKLTSFYSDHFVFKNPEDTEMELISRTIGIDRIVDEFIFRFTHNLEVDWLAPGIPPTGKRLEIPFTAIVNIRGDRLYHEHIAWDQGTVLAQLGLLPEYLPYPYALPDGRQPAEGKKFEYRVPVAGIETAEKMRDKNSVESNEMFGFKVREV